jgi:hypothetical protein
MATMVTTMNRINERGIAEYHNRIHRNNSSYYNHIPATFTNHLHHYYHKSIDDLTVTAESNQLCRNHFNNGVLWKTIN